MELLAGTELSIGDFIHRQDTTALACGFHPFQHHRSPVLGPVEVDKHTRVVVVVEGILTLHHLAEYLINGLDAQTALDPVIGKQRFLGNGGTLVFQCQLPTVIHFVNVAL